MPQWKSQPIFRVEHCAAHNSKEHKREFRMPTFRPLYVACIAIFCTLVFSISSPLEKNAPGNLASVNAELSTAGSSAEADDSSSASSTIGELIEETGFYQSIRLSSDAPIYQKQSAYQFIEVRHSPYYGKILVLDGVVQLTERDADSYNEMLAHIPLFQHPRPVRVLLIGGGDGYVLSEILKHPSVEHVDHVDLDGEVVETCREHFSWNQAWNDKRVSLHIADGAAFVKNAAAGAYDVIVQDSSDPWTWSESGEKIVLPSSVLYSAEHFSNIYRALSPGGILNIQAETLQIPSDVNGVRDWRNLALSVGFESSRYGSIMISSYPTGQIGFLLCEKDAGASSSAQQIQTRFDEIVANGKATSYYHPPLQTASFVLPLWAEQHIYATETSPSVTEEL